MLRNFQIREAFNGFEVFSAGKHFQIADSYVTSSIFPINAFNA